MRTIIKSTTLRTLKGEEYKFPTNIYYQIKESKNRANNKFDNVVVITGGVGSGKSNLTKGINGTYEEVFYERPYTLNNVHFLIESVLEQFDKTDNHTIAINYDEAVQGGTGRDGLTKIGQKLRTTLITRRTKRHLLTLAIDNPKELNDKIIERCIAWYHVFYIRTKRGEFIKGLFKVFSAKELHIVYNDLKNYRYRFVEDHPIFKRNWRIYKSWDYSNLWYSDKQYDKKKLIQTKSTDPDNKPTISTIFTKTELETLNESLELFKGQQKNNDAQYHKAMRLLKKIGKGIDLENIVSDTNTYTNAEN